MKERTVMALVEMPGWLQASGCGLLSASGLLIGAVGGYYTGSYRAALECGRRDDPHASSLAYGLESH